MDWLAYVLDFIVVVGGIFAGLRVNKWNNERQDRKTEKQYIARLFDDTETMLSDQQVDINWNSNRMETAGVVLQALRSGSLEDNQREPFEHGLTYLGQMNPVRRRWATVRELQSTGRLGILRDIELRILLGEIEASFDFSNHVWAVQRNLIEGLRSDVTKRFEVLESGFIEADKVSIIYDFDDLKGDQELRKAVSHITAYSNIILRAHERHYEKVVSLRNKLKALLEKP